LDEIRAYYLPIVSPVSLKIVIVSLELTQLRKALQSLEVRVDATEKSILESGKLNSNNNNDNDDNSNLSIVINGRQQPQQQDQLKKDEKFCCWDLPCCF